MAFSQEIVATITGRGAINISLYVPDSVSEEVQSGQLSVQVKFSDGEIKERNFDLLTRLTDDSAGQTHLQNLISLRDYILARVDSEVLGL